VAVVAAIATAALVALTAVQSTLTLQDTDFTVSNPIGLAGIQDPEQSTVGAVSFLLVLGCMVAAVVSIGLRFRRSQGVERQQLKWFTYAGALLILWTLVTQFLFPKAASWTGVVFGLLLAFVPVAAGVAILRYRLYDIDRLINRTLVYGLLTGLLGLVYAGVVLVLGQLFGGVGGNLPSGAVAGATLSVAALFQPTRRRIQAVVDRRFNRRKYDAAKTVEAFSARLRDEVDLDALSAELLTVADQTMQPTTASIWLRPSAPARPRGQGQGS
jgi:peptidoglycan/LPS O-acetylase OafA/YrhL